MSASFRARRIRPAAPELAELQDALSEKQERDSAAYDAPLGIPVGPKYVDYTASLGEMVLVQPQRGSMIVYLPRVKRWNRGAVVTVINQSYDTSLITLKPATGSVTVNAMGDLPVSCSPYSCITAVVLSDTEWLVTVDGKTPKLWWKWNETDLLQFDAPVYGSNISPETAPTVVSAAGVNWIHIQALASASAGMNQSTCVLPVTKTPPSADYMILADFYSTSQVTGGGGQEWVGAFVGVRYQDDGVAPPNTRLDDGYLIRYLDRAGVSAAIDIVWLKDTGGGNLGVTQSVPVIAATNNGMEMGIGVEGESVVKTRCGENQVALHTSSIVTAKGQAFIGTDAVTAGADTAANRFRNIRCYCTGDSL